MSHARDVFIIPDDELVVNAARTVDPAVHFDGLPEPPVFGRRSTPGSPHPGSPHPGSPYTHAPDSGTPDQATSPPVAVPVTRTDSKTDPAKTLLDRLRTPPARRSPATPASAHNAPELAHEISPPVFATSNGELNGLGVPPANLTANAHRGLDLELAPVGLPESEEDVENFWLDEPEAKREFRPELRPEFRPEFRPELEIKPDRQRDMSVERSNTAHAQKDHVEPSIVDHRLEPAPRPMEPFAGSQQSVPLPARPPSVGLTSDAPQSVRHAHQTGPINTPSSAQVSSVPTSAPASARMPPATAHVSASPEPVIAPAAAQLEPARPEPARPEPTRPEPTRTEPTRIEPYVDRRPPPEPRAPLDVRAARLSPLEAARAAAGQSPYERRPAYAAGGPAQAAGSSAQAAGSSAQAASVSAQSAPLIGMTTAAAPPAVLRSSWLVRAASLVLAMGLGVGLTVLALKPAALAPLIAMIPSEPPDTTAVAPKPVGSNDGNPRRTTVAAEQPPATQPVGVNTAPPASTAAAMSAPPPAPSVAPAAVAVAAPPSVTVAAPDAGNSSAKTTRSFLAAGRARLEKGDIAAARSFFQRAADLGDGDAAFALAETFDPNQFRRLGIIGMKPDMASARRWYELAVERGRPEARAALARLTR